MRKRIAWLSALFVALSCTATVAPSLSASPSPAASVKLQLVGSIDSHYPIKMTLERNGTTLKGSYKYLPKGGDLTLTGSESADGHIKMDETDEHHAKTGVFEGLLFVDNRMSGMWTGEKDKASMRFLVLSDNDPKAFDSGKYGIVIIEEKKHIPKPKGDSVRNPTFVSYPVVMKELFADQKVANQLQDSLSLDKIFGIKNVVKSAVDGTDTWTEEISYEVKFNYEYLVDIYFTMSGVAAYPDSTSREFVFSTKTGKRLTADDVFVKTSQPELKREVNVLLQQAIKQVQADNASDKEAAQSIKDLTAGKQFGTNDLNNFSVSERGVTFLYHWGFPHVAVALEPQGEFFIPYNKLASAIRKDGPLAALTFHTSH